uniref:Uncharacterized protein n=1 Tax=Anguilla anguilla TaxID=7936 RepID=A0A0E9WS74_ANGAN
MLKHTERILAFSLALISHNSFKHLYTENKKMLSHTNECLLLHQVFFPKYHVDVILFVKSH